MESVCLPFKAATMQKARGHAGGASPPPNPMCLGTGQLAWVPMSGLCPLGLAARLLRQGFVYVKLGGRC